MGVTVSPVAWHGSNKDLSGNNLNLLLRKLHLESTAGATATYHY